MLTKVQKRDGSFQDFSEDKITNAVYKALRSTKLDDKRVAKRLSYEVARRIEFDFKTIVPKVEDIQDVVEKTLIKNGYADAAKAYILYREKRKELREEKTFLGIKDDLKFDLNAIAVLKQRYLLKDENGEVIETPKQMFKRVAKAVAKAEKNKEKRKVLENEFFNAMASREFMPNSPTLMNAGTKLGQLSACFVVPVEDSIDSIFNAVKDMAEIHQSGGGTGFSFSKLRPAGDIVMSTKGSASGPVSFMRVFDVATDVIKQGGKRRGANMGILSVNHPDVVEFIAAKTNAGFLKNFNISVSVTDKFMNAVVKDKKIDLINPRTEKKTKTVHAKELFNLISTMAWKTGDPGMIFIDEINRKNPLKKLGNIEATNPCGEQMLFAYESCNLGSINLEKVVKDKKIDWQKLKKLVHLGVEFLDNVIDVNKYPLKQVEKITKANRKIGLGVMGWANLLIKLGISYDSNEALKLAEKLMKFVANEARKKSAELGVQKGSFPNFKNSTLYGKYKAMRNSTVTTVAPTGTISIIAGTSSGIEPLFAVSFVRDVLEGTKLIETNPYFEQTAKEKGFYSRKLMMDVSKKGSIIDVEEIPDDVKKVFVTALDIKPEWHVKMQAAFQKYTDNAVSKTVNLPYDASVEDVRKVYLLAHKLKCKGITVYRYGSKPEQVLYLGTAPDEKDGHVRAGSEYSGGCPATYCPF